MLSQCAVLVRPRGKARRARLAASRGEPSPYALGRLLSLAILSGALITWTSSATILRALPCTEQVDATYYHPSLAGDAMANGRPYDPHNPVLAASNRYRLGTLLLLSRLDGHGAVLVEVMDRGSPELGVDLSEAAFQVLEPLSVGRIPVCVRAIRA
jgi:rare lipoprotein A (peptidoglycan hydrolase)